MTGAVVRPALPEDLPTVAGIWVRSWQVGYAGIVPPAALDAQDPDHRLRQLRQPAPGTELSVAAVDAAVVGFVVTGPWRGADAGADVGEVWAIYVSPEHWGRGAGRALLDQGRRRLIARGYQELRLWVLADNARARRFYESSGWGFDGATQTYQIGGVELPEVRYRTLA
ncbi:MAG: GNAT family N-acetyltransferase [Actinomycetota bacterium]|nr:GNAT family N-acetyltransferase [Actinomycetota bacterium]